MDIGPLIPRKFTLLNKFFSEKLDLRKNREIYKINN